MDQVDDPKLDQPLKRPKRVGCLFSIGALLLLIPVSVLTDRLAFNGELSGGWTWALSLPLGALALIVGVASLIKSSLFASRLQRRFREVSEGVGLREVYQAGTFSGSWRERPVHAWEGAGGTQDVLEISSPLARPFPGFHLASHDESGVALERALALHPIEGLGDLLEGRRCYGADEAWVRGLFGQEVLRQALLTLTESTDLRAALVKLEGDQLNLRLVGLDLARLTRPWLGRRLDALTALAEGLEGSHVAPGAADAPIRAAKPGGELARAAAAAIVKKMMFGAHSFIPVGLLLLSLVGIVGSYWASSTYRTLDLSPVIGLSFGLTVIFLGVAFALLRLLLKGAPPWSVVPSLLLALLGGPFLSGALLIGVNGALDRGPEARHVVRVIRGVTRDEGRGQSSTWAEVTSWREGRPWERVKVSRRYNESMRPGDEMIVRTKGGALGMEWVSGLDSPR